MIAGGGAARAVAASAGHDREVRIGATRLVTTEPYRRTGTAVLLLPTIAGVDAYMTRVAADLAETGHLVAAWDPYDGKPVPGDTMGQLALSKAIRDDDAMRGIQRAVDHLRSEGARSIASIGWCLGGRYALLHAGLDDRVAALASYNPTIYSPTPADVQGRPTSKADFPGQTLDEFGLARRIACPVQIARPGHDLAQPAEYDKLQHALYARSAPTWIDYFPDATHGFTYQPRSDADRVAAEFAWAGTIALLRVALR